MISPSPIECLLIALIVILYIEFLKMIAIKLCSNIKTQFTFVEIIEDDRGHRCGRPIFTLFILLSSVIVYLYFSYK